MPCTDDQNVWWNIVQYYRISLASDETIQTGEQRSIQRRTLLSIALTCSSLASVALNELWRSMTTLEPAVRIYKSATTSLEYNAKETVWVLDISPERRKALAPRLQSYLHRIRCLRLTRFPDLREYGLWHVLLLLAGTSSLCPNLAELNCHLNTQPPLNFFHAFPLNTPTLQRIALTASVNWQKSVDILQKILMGQNVDTLNEISYKGATSPQLLNQISHFRSLRHLSLNSFTENQLDESHIESLEKLRQLRHVDLDLNAFAGKAMETIGRWLAGLEELSNLSLSVPRDHVKRCVFNERTYHHVSDLTLRFKNHPSSDFLSLIPSSFPSLQKFAALSIVTNLDDSLEFEKTGLMALKAFPMTAIKLCNFRLHISFERVITILRTWPLLEVFHIVPAAGSSFSDLESFHIMLWISSHCDRLHELCLPISLSDLATTTITSPLPSNCPLRSLSLSYLSNYTHEIWDQGDTFVRNLIRLFPQLAINHPETIRNRDVYKILDGYKLPVTSPSSGSSRYDTLEKPLRRFGQIRDDSHAPT